MIHVIKRTLALFCLCLSTLAFASDETPPDDLPLEGDLGVHDPVMIRHGDNYYVFSTGRGVSIKKSPDMTTWADIGRVFARDELPEWHRNHIPDQNGHLWAPDIHYSDGKYHLYYSVSAWMNFNSSIGYATNETLDPEDPNYEWVDRGEVISFQNGGEGVNVIDPNVFIDEDGTKWLVYGSYRTGLRMTRLDPETGKLPSEDPDLTVLTTSLGEGVFIMKGPEYYYIFASRGRCCSGLDSTYQIVMGRSENVEGPYLTREGESWVDNHYTLLLAGDHEEPGRGHNGFYVEDGTTWIVYHAYTRSADGRSLLNIRKMYLDEDGWPTLEPTGEPFRTASFQEAVFHGE